MRKRIRILVLAAIVAAVVVPVGFALSLESSSRAATSSAVYSAVPVSEISAKHSPIVATTTAAVTALPEVSEGAKLFAIGTVLFGLAAAMRRRGDTERR